jgi:hypothetical protein
VPVVVVAFVVVALVVENAPGLVFVVIAWVDVSLVGKVATESAVGVVAYQVVVVYKAVAALVN